MFRHKLITFHSHSRVFHNEHDSYRKKSMTRPPNMHGESIVPLFFFFTIFWLHVATVLTMWYFFFYFISKFQVDNAFISQMHLCLHLFLAHAFIKRKEAQSIPRVHIHVCIHACSFSWLNIGILIISGEVKVIPWAQAFPINEMIVRKWYNN
jgi:ABC-type iron transport system FetAB permease component